MKHLFMLAIAATAAALSIDTASAQYGDVVPIQRNYLGQLACPSNYVIRGNVCVSIYAGGGRYNEGGGYGRRRGAVVRPVVNPYGQLQCPGNYVLDYNNNCVSIYARREGY